MWSQSGESTGISFETLLATDVFESDKNARWQSSGLKILRDYMWGWEINTSTIVQNIMRNIEILGERMGRGA